MTRTAFVTGGTRGIGKAIVQRLKEDGLQVAAGYSGNTEAAEATARELGVMVVKGNVGSFEDCERAVREVEAQLGPIDVLVNNAAFQMAHETLEEIDDDEWVKTFDINITAIFRICKAALPSMPKGSSIINTSSVNSDDPSPSLLPYAATKGAIANFTAGLAQLLGKKGIRVNSVAPGPIWTPLIPATMPDEAVRNFGSGYPMGRPGQPVEVAPIYVLLASDEASYISGSRYAVTGGKPIL